MRKVTGKPQKLFLLLLLFVLLLAALSILYVVLYDDISWLQHDARTRAIYTALGITSLGFLGWFFGMGLRWVMLIIALTLIIPMGLNYSGFCMSEAKWFNQNEFLDYALRYEVANGGLQISATEEAVSSFLKENPKCCTVSKESSEFPNSPLKKLLGLYYLVVNVQYRLNDLEISKAPNDGDYYDSYLFMDACGKVIDRPGTRIEKNYTRFRIQN